MISFRFFVCFVVMSFFVSGTTWAEDEPVVKEPALLVIGASYSDARLPFNDALEAPLGGIAIDFGSYLSLGNALIRDKHLPGYVINEAQAGATTFDRPGCNPGPGCDAGEWQGYGTQFQKALARVTLPFPPFTRNAAFVVITIANDCLHSDAFGIPQDQAIPCDATALNAYIDRLIDLGEEAISLGITPIFDVYPKWSRIDLPLTGSLFGLLWVLDEAAYNTLRDLHRSRLESELPGAIVLDMWKGFKHRGDGLHPSDKTSKKAAKRIAKLIGGF